MYKSLGGCSRLPPASLTRRAMHPWSVTSGRDTRFGVHGGWQCIATQSTSDAHLYTKYG